MKCGTDIENLCCIETRVKYTRLYYDPNNWNSSAVKLNLQSINARPFGLHFLEDSSSQDRVALNFHYHEDAGYTVLFQHGKILPLVEAVNSLAVTQTITFTREHPEDGDDHNYGDATYTAVTFLSTVTSTRSSEGPDENDPDRLH